MGRCRAEKERAAAGKRDAAARALPGQKPPATDGGKVALDPRLVPTVEDLSWDYSLRNIMVETKNAADWLTFKSVAVNQVRPRTLEEVVHTCRQATAVVLIIRAHLTSPPRPPPRAVAPSPPWEHMQPLADNGTVNNPPRTP